MEMLGETGRKFELIFKKGAKMMRQVIQKGVLGATVRDWAAMKGIPISTLERESGYSPGMISRWIAAGKEDYNALSKLVTLADQLGISLDELVGRQKDDAAKASSNDLISQIRAETCDGRLTWLPWKPEDNCPVTSPIPACESGRSCCGGWWAERDQLKILLVQFCDDLQDEDELLELCLYCTPGHGLPVLPLVTKYSSALSELYTWICLIASFGTAKGADTSASLLCDAAKLKTIPFRAQN